MYYFLVPDHPADFRRFTLTPPHSNELLLPDDYAEHEEGSFGSITWQHVSGHGFQLYLHVFELSGPQQLTLLANRSSISLLHMVRGKVSFMKKKEPESHLYECEYALFHLPKGEHAVQMAAGQHVIVQIELHTKLVEPLAFEYFAIFDVWTRFKDREKSIFCSCIPVMSNQLLDMLSRLLYNKLEGSRGDLCRQARMLDLLALYIEDVANCYETNNRPAPGGFSFSAEDIMAVRRARELQLEKAGEELTLEDIARMVNMHKKKLQAGFQMLYQRNVGELTIQARIEKAKKLLRETELSITDIAYEAGYGTPSAFIRAFRRAEGITPATYRK
ncbi:AraC family transcriptional regulator [Chitinophaga sp.]|uniref:helix-turn-helix transcriptional regulator n=1 Tax=Chitinophaga sp. TaxID=1869181 RepID=UPI0031D219F1